MKTLVSVKTIAVASLVLTASKTFAHGEHAVTDHTIYLITAAAVIAVMAHKLISKRAENK